MQGHLTELNPSDKASAWNSEDVLGLYEKEDGFVWLQKNSQIMLDSKNIKNDGGLEIDYSTPAQLQRQTVIVWINGKNVSIRTYEQETNDKIIILTEQLPDDFEGTYTIEIACSDSFIPSQLGESADDRELGIRIHYIGGMQ